MPRDYRPYEPDQTLMFPPSLRDWLPEDHLAFFLSDTIDSLDLSAFDKRYGDEGPGIRNLAGLADGCVKLPRATRGPAHARFRMPGRGCCARGGECGG